MADSWDNNVMETSLDLNPGRTALGILWYAMIEFAPGTATRMILYDAYLYVLNEEVADNEKIPVLEFV